jgi:hypothetical protein
MVLTEKAEHSAINDVVPKNLFHNFDQSSCHKMNQFLEPELGKIDGNPSALFGRPLSARDLESRVHVIVPVIPV